MLKINAELNAAEALVLERVLMAGIRATSIESATEGTRGNNSKAFAFSQLGNSILINIAKKLGLYNDKPNEL